MNSTFTSSHKEVSMTPMVCTSMRRDLIKMEDITMKRALTLIRTENLINYYNKNLRKEGETTKKMTSLLSSLRRRSKKMIIMTRFKKSIITNSKLKGSRKSLGEPRKMKICQMTKKKHRLSLNLKL